MGPFSQWIINAPLWLVAIALIVSLIVSALLGWWARVRLVGSESSDNSDQEGYILTAVSGLLALLIGFTFSMAIDRFDARRLGVVDDANAIEASYLKSQILPEPHRAQMSHLLIAYTDNKVLLGEARPGQKQDALLAKNEQLKSRIWLAAIAAFPSIKSLDFSSSFVDTVSALMQTDAARKASRRAHVPGQVYAILFLYQLVTAGVYGYILVSRRGREIAAFLLLLFAFSMVLVIEIDRPVTGRINESQDAMIQLQQTLRERPPQMFSALPSPTQEP